MSSIYQKYATRVEQIDSLLCVGLDSKLDRLPEHFLADETPQFAFNRWIIEQTHSYVSAYKPNTAFYEARGAQGWHELKLTLDYLHEKYPDIVTICDAKRADIGSTNIGYVQAIFDDLGFDAVTLQPYLGQEALMPFLEREDKACIILCRTSNAGAGEFQDLQVGTRPLWQIVAEQVVTKWNANKNCMLVVGATAPEQLGVVREFVADMPILAPGIGTQGGDLAAVMQAGLDSNGQGLIINVSRDIIFGDNPATQAQYYQNEIKQYRV